MNIVRSGFAAGTVRLVTLLMLAAGLTTLAFALERAPARKTRLPNGLVLIVQEDHSLPLVGLQTIARAGRIAETRATNGAAALLAEVMGSQGTAKKPGGAFRAEISAEGSVFEALTDEETLRLETTCSPDTLEANLERHSALMLEPNLAPDALNRAREKLLSQLARKKEYPRHSGYLGERCSALAFGEHPYGLPEADPELVQKLSPADLEAFRAKRVTPDAMRIVVAGDCDPEKVLALVQKLYGKLPAAGQSGPRPQSAVAPEKPRERTEQLDAKQTVACVGFLAPSIFDRDFHAMVVIRSLLGLGKTSRLKQRLIARERLAGELSADFRWLPSTSLLTVDFACSAGAVEPTVQAILAEVERLRAVDVPGAELERAKTYLATQLALASQKRVAQAELLGRFDLFDDMEFVAELPDRIAQVTATAVRDAARRWLDLSRFSLAVLQPRTGETTKTERVWSGQLSNGLKVVLYRDPASAAVGLGLLAGSPPDAPEDQVLSNMALAELLQKGNTSRSTSAQTLGRLEAAGTAIGGRGDADGVQLWANASLHNLDEILAVLREVAFEQAFTAQDLADTKAQGKRRLALAVGSPEALAASHLMANLFPGHRYGRPLEACAAGLDALTLEALQREHKRLFTTGNVHLAVAGNVTSTELVPRLEGLLGSLPATAPLTGAAPAMPPPSTKELESCEHERGDVMAVGIRLPSEARVDLAPLSVLFRVLGLGPESLLEKGLEEAGILEDRLGAGLTFLKDAGFITFQYRVKQGSAEQAREIAEKAFETLKSGGISARQIEVTGRVVQGYLVRELEDVLVQALRTLAAGALLGDADFYSRLAHAYGTVTPESVQAAAKKHLGTVRIVLVKGKSAAK
jgi:zinc protease